MSSAEPISVVCRPEGGGWSCTVQVGSGARSTRHDVSVSLDELDRLAPGLTEPTSLVEQSFRFLLEREPNESILSRFAITDIENYFPDYPTVIGRRMGAPVGPQGSARNHTPPMPSPLVSPGKRSPLK